MLGAKVACPDRKVISISGDGAFGDVKRIQQTKYGGRMIGVDLHNTDLVALANSFGMRGTRADTLEAPRHALRDAFTTLFRR